MVDLASVAAIAPAMMTTTTSTSWSRTFISGAIAPNPGDGDERGPTHGDRGHHDHHHVRPQRRAVQRRSDDAADRVQRREGAGVELLGAHELGATRGCRMASRTA